jgi:hypothetical protein
MYFRHVRADLIRTQESRAMLIPNFDRLGQEAQGARCPSWVNRDRNAMSAVRPFVPQSQT